MTGNRDVIAASKKRATGVSWVKKMLADKHGLSDTYPDPKGMLCYNDPGSVHVWSWQWSIPLGFHGRVWYLGYE